VVAPDDLKKFLSRNRIACLTAVLAFPLSEIAALVTMLANLRFAEHEAVDFSRQTAAAHAA
jgi:hypothetical protein